MVWIYFRIRLWYSQRSRLSQRTILAKETLTPEWVILSCCFLPSTFASAGCPLGECGSLFSGHYSLALIPLGFLRQKREDLLWWPSRPHALQHLGCPLGEVGSLFSRFFPLSPLALGFAREKR